MVTSKSIKDKSSVIMVKIIKIDFFIFSFFPLIHINATILTANNMKINIINNDRTIGIISKSIINYQFTALAFSFFQSSGIAATLYLPAANFVFASVKACSVISISSSVCAAEGIKRKMICPFGMTG